MNLTFDDVTKPISDHTKNEYLNWHDKYHSEHNSANNSDERWNQEEKWSKEGKYNTYESQEYD